MSPVILRYRVDGLNCPSCVRKVEKGLSALPGVSDVDIRMVSQIVTLTLDESTTSRDDILATGRRVGHAFHLTDASSPDAPSAPAHPHDHEGSSRKPESHGHDHAPVEDAWYRSTQGKAVVWSGALLALAFLVSLIWPSVERYAYSLAALLGALPLVLGLLRERSLESLGSIESLAVIAALGAVAIDAAAEGATVVFLFNLGELLEGLATTSTRRRIRALAELTPKTAQLRQSDGQLVTVSADSLTIGQTIYVRPGERIPADGLIVEGTSGVDESALTGESAPVFKEGGDQVFAGSINTDGALLIEVEKEASDNTIARIIRLIEDAEAERAPTARFIDRFSRVYTPLVVVIAALVAILPPTFMGAEWYPWIYRALTLLLIACPCALVISVPAAIVAAIGGGARHGLLVKGGVALETLARVTTVAFDKTGTLTEGRFSLSAIEAFEGDDNTLLTLAASIEQGSVHPLALAIMAEADTRSLSLSPVAEARAEAGKYVEADIDGRLLFIGSPRFLPEGVSTPDSMSATLERWEADGQTALVLWDRDRVLGLIGLRDTLRSESPATVSLLRQMGIQPLILTGDNARAADGIARMVGADVRADLLPEDKLNAIRAMQDEGGTVAMIGDGINDAPALMQADVGLAMGQGTALALETADAALLRNDLRGVPGMIRLARATMGIIRQNVAVSIGLKVLFLILTLFGYTYIWMAVLADTGTMILVTLNALRLLIFRPIPEKWTQYERP